jgi:hypothetical protein
MSTKDYPSKLAAAVLALACGTSFGAALLEAPTADGWVTLHSEAGTCVSGARKAEWSYSAGGAALLGCWRLSDGGVAVAWLDGYSSFVPPGLLSKVKPL